MVQLHARFRHWLIMLSWLHTDVPTIFRKVLCAACIKLGVILVQVLLGRWRGAKVAVKILKTSVQADAAISANFKSEAKILCRLRHPNIMDFYGACLRADTVRLALAEACKDGFDGLSLILCCVLIMCVPCSSQMMIVSQVRNLLIQACK